MAVRDKRYDGPPIPILFLIGMGVYQVSVIGTDHRRTQSPCGCLRSLGFARISSRALNAPTMSR